MNYLSDNKRCREYYALLRWGGNPICPHCNAVKPYLLKSGKYRCSSKTCKMDFSVVKGTIFEKSKIPLATWMGAVYLLSGHKKGISSLQLGRDLGVSPKTAWFLLHRIRHIMGDPDPEPLDASFVEVAETWVGGKFGNMHGKKRKKFQDLGIDNKLPVMGLLERDGKARLTVIGEKSFKDVVRENVNTNAVLITDTHLSYQGLSNEYSAHWTINHSQGEYKNGVIYTNTVEGFFSSLKRSIYGIYHSVSPKHLQRYCEETSFRYNTRKMTDKERFLSTMQMAEGHRLTYNSLIQKTIENEK